MNIDKVREEFEQWVRNRFKHVAEIRQTKDGYYSVSDVSAAWATWEHLAAIDGQGEPVGDIDLRHALEMVDGCMDETQVEPEDAAAWQVVRKQITAPPAAVPAPDDNLNWLLSDMDGQKWADEFCKRNPSMNHGLMLSWFCCAIMTGYDEANRRRDKDAPAPDHSDNGIQHDEPTGPNHPGHHNGMTCERAAQVIVDLIESQYPGSSVKFKDVIADAAKQAAAPAQAVDAPNIKPWRERCSEQSAQYVDSVARDCIESEIAELRAALAAQSKQLTYTEVGALKKMPSQSSARSAYSDMTIQQKDKLENDMKVLERRIAERNRSCDRRLQAVPVDVERRVGDRRHREPDAGITQCLTCDGKPPFCGTPTCLPGYAEPTGGAT